jgi:hypothetical protein
VGNRFIRPSARHAVPALALFVAGMPGREPSKNRRRSALALGLSALVHLGLAVWLLTRPPTVPQWPQVERPPALEVEIAYAPEKAKPPVTSVPPPAATSGAVEVRRRVRGGSGGTKSESTAKAQVGTVAPSGTSDSNGPIADVPERHRFQLPEVLLPHLAGDLDDLEGGHTFREDPRAHGRSNKEKAAEAERRIDGWLEDAEAEHRVDVGLVDPWFAKLKKRFEHDAAEPRTVPEHVLAKVGSALVKQYVEGASRYGASGNPGNPSPGGSSVLSFTGTGVNDQFPMPVPPSLGSGGGEGPFSELSLVTVVDLHQDPDGSLLSAQIVVRSGDPAFDRYVLDIIPKSMEMVDPPPDAGLGFHDKGSHTVWEFAGRLTFMRDVKDMNLSRDGWYFLPAALIGGVKFDEVSGYVGMAVSPYYKCQVRLLRMY